jgi:hypothetical protein
VTSLGDTVHYVARGSLDGVYPPTCRAAIVTEVGSADRVGICAVNPTGLFFHPLPEGCLRGQGPGEFHDPSECLS